MEMNGIDLNVLKTIASLAQIDQDGREYHIKNAVRELPGLKDMITEYEIFAGLADLPTRELDERIKTAQQVLQVLGEEIPGE